MAFEDPERKLCSLYQVGAASPVDATDAMERALEAALGDAQRTFPQVDVRPDSFMPFLAERAGAGGPDAVSGTRAADLFLVCGCLRGDKVATVLVDDVLTAACATALRRQGADASAVDEVSQLVREKLLVGGTNGPAIASYSGRGALKSWIRAVAVRTFLNTLRGQREEAKDDEEFFDRVAAHDDPGLAHMRAEHRDQFKSAFYAAMAALPDRDKNLLRYFYVDGLNLDELGKMHEISRATAHRWLARAKAAASDATLEALRAALGASDASARSIRRLVLSDMDITLRKLFPEPPE